jgi:hypothetical protein
MTKLIAIITVCLSLAQGSVWAGHKTVVAKVGKKIDRLESKAKKVAKRAKSKVKKQAKQKIKKIIEVLKE